MPVHKVGRLIVLPVPYLADNLGYIVYSQKGNDSLQLELLVDPGDYEMVLKVLADWSITGSPQAIFSTHKHHDHAGNNHLFERHWPGVKIVGGEGE